MRSIVVLGLVFSVPCQEIGSKECLQNYLFLCQVGHKTLLNSL